MNCVGPCCEAVRMRFGGKLRAWARCPGTPRNSTFLCPEPRRSPRSVPIVWTEFGVIHSRECMWGECHASRPGVGRSPKVHGRHLRFSLLGGVKVEAVEVLA